MTTESTISALDELDLEPPTTASIKFRLYGREKEEVARKAKLKVFKSCLTGALANIGWDSQVLLGEHQYLQLGDIEDLHDYISQHHPTINKLLVRLVFPTNTRGFPDLFDVTPEVQAIFGWLWPLAGRCEFAFSVSGRSGVKIPPEWIRAAILGTILMQFMQHVDPEMPTGDLRVDTECSWGLGEELDVVSWEPVGVAI
jgi:hypothetical protein